MPEILTLGFWNLEKNMYAKKQISKEKT